MVWGCMSAGQLSVCEGTMNSPKYCQILEHDMLPSAHALFNRWRAQHWIFQQDNAPCHTARARKTWVNDHGVQLLDWPAQSLDSGTSSKQQFMNVNQEICKSSGGLWSANGIISRENSANALLKTSQRESRYWWMHVAKQPNIDLWNIQSCIISFIFLVICHPWWLFVHVCSSLYACFLGYCYFCYFTTFIKYTIFLSNLCINGLKLNLLGIQKLVSTTVAPEPGNSVLRHCTILLSLN